MSPAPSRYSNIKAIWFDKLNKTGDGSLLKREPSPRFKKEGAG